MCPGMYPKIVKQMLMNRSVGSISDGQGNVLGRDSVALTHTTSCFDEHSDRRDLQSRLAGSGLTSSTIVPKDRSTYRV